MDAGGTTADALDHEAAGWARATLVFARDPDGVTYIRRQHVAYPFHICRLHSFDGDPAGMRTLYRQSCAGGIFEGARFLETIVAEEGALVHVTSQAATIVHSMNAGVAHQTVRISAAPHAFVEYLPDPLILFPRSRLASRLHIQADRDATVIACDSFMLHDPGSRGECFERFSNALEIADADNNLLALDRFDLTGEAWRRSLSGAGLYPVQATLLALHRDGADALCAAMRDALASVDGIYAGASTLPHACGAWVRILARDGVASRRALNAVWCAARRSLTGTEPRIRPK